MKRICAVIITGSQSEGREKVYLLANSLEAANVELRAKYGAENIYSVEEGDFCDADAYWSVQERN